MIEELEKSQNLPSNMSEREREWKEYLEKLNAKCCGHREEASGRMLLKSSNNLRMRIHSGIDVLIITDCWRRYDTIKNTNEMMKS